MNEGFDMNYSNWLRKLLISIISWTLCLAPLAQEAATQKSEGEPVEVLVSAEVESQDSANYCIDKPEYSAKVQECKSQNLEINCHLNVCASAADNRDYNKEYNDCNAKPTEMQEACKKNLRDFGAELAAHNEKTSKSNPGAMDTTLPSVVGLGCAAYFGFTCPDGIGAMLAGGVALAAAFMAFQNKESKKQFKAAADMLKEEDSKDQKGWNAHTQSASLQKQITAMDMVISAAKKKAKNHTMVAALAGISATIALICIATSWFTGCVAENPCSPYVSVAGYIVMALELTAAQDSKKVASEWSKNKTKAEKLKKKLDSMYNKDMPSMALMQKPNVASNLSGARTAINLGTGMAASIADSSRASVSEFAQCVSSSNEVVSCPCKDSSCKKVSYSVPNKGIGAQVAQKLNLSDWEKAQNNAYNGDYSGLDALSTDKNLALINGVNKKLAKHILDKKLVKGEAAEQVGDILDEGKFNKRLAAFKNSNLNPVRAAVLNHRYGSSAVTAPTSDKPLENLLASNDYYKMPKYDDSTLKNNLNKLESSLNFDGLEGNIEGATNGFNVDSAFTDSGEDSSTEGDVSKSINSINPERKLSIFKIISNRYNLVRVNKRFGN
ncbi:hypothetical protein [Bacteriovorax sp. Seq25_V]|uniref:hypothetical protein n=1 Tax=Bacteriovorax sp. Seq25_V TaxID=1201288 RepID=UPI000389EF58|nr:hypothetical protein [Bacteriovorax sp. Seq25_V]EQC43802.1 hypothetical protein M900_1348 [Bacteriovorax sp. Seq25_V]